MPTILRDPFGEARQNTAYRRVLGTGKKTQIVAMSLPPGEDIGEERHAHVEQLLGVVAGSGRGVVNGQRFPLRAGDLLLARPGQRHNILNAGGEPLKLVTVYAPPNHLKGRVQHTKAEAEADVEDRAFGEGSALESHKILVGGLALAAGLAGARRLGGITYRPMGLPADGVALACTVIAALVAEVYLERRDIARPLAAGAAGLGVGMLVGARARAA
jgi:mannose-6-phosphate isomerase-like protein (cupin superfamily)